MTAVSIGAAGIGAVGIGYEFPKPHLRLTRRGRAVFTTLAALPLVIAAFMFAFAGEPATATMDEAQAQSYQYVTIVTGQSLWAVASEIAPTADPREVVADILSFNGMSSADLLPGQRLALPPQYS